MTEIVQLSRRNFLKLSGAAAAATGLAGTGVKTAFAQDSGGPTYDTMVPTLCEQCVWRCGVLAKIKDGKVHKLDGNPNNAHSNGMLCALAGLPSSLWILPSLILARTPQRHTHCSHNVGTIVS